MSDIEKVRIMVDNIYLLCNSINEIFNKSINSNEKIINTDKIYEPHESLFFWFKNTWLLRKEEFALLFTAKQLEELHKYSKNFDSDKKDIEEFIYIWGMFIEPDEELRVLIKLLHETDLAKHNFIMMQGIDDAIDINDFDDGDSVEDE